MSSVYPSYGGMQTWPCQRCNVPLPPNDFHCRNCGYYNGPPMQGNNSAHVGQQPFPNVYQGGGPVSQGQYGQNPGQYNGGAQMQPPTPFAPNGPFAPDQVGQRSFFGIPSTPAPSVSHTSLSSFAPPSQPGVPPTQSPWGSPPAAGYAGPPTGYPQVSGVFPPGMAMGPQASGPPSLAGYQPNGAGMPQNQNSKGRRSKAGIIFLVVALLLVVVVGSFAGYTLLSKQSSAQVTHPSVAKPIQPKGPLLFTDSFKDNSNGWNLQSYSGKFSAMLANGSLQLEDKNNELLWELLPGGKSFGDFTLTVDAALSKGEQNNGYGIYIRSSSVQTDLATYYRFELYGDGSYAAFKGKSDANGTLSSSQLVNYTLDPAISKQGGVNHIVIVAKGSSMSLTVNGQALTTITDSSYVNGSIAFFVSNLQNAQPDAQASFSNLNIYGI